MSDRRRAISAAVLALVACVSAAAPAQALGVRVGTVAVEIPVVDAIVSQVCRASGCPVP